MAIKITLEYFNFLVLVAEHIFVVIGEDSLFKVTTQVLKEIDHAGAVGIRAKAVRNYWNFVILLVAIDIKEFDWEQYSFVGELNKDFINKMD